MKNHIVLHEYKTVIFCIPKVANSSIKAAVLTALGYRVTEDVPHGHSALNLSEPPYIGNRCQDYFKFAVVRNPFDRLVSCWKQKICTDRVLTQGFEPLGFYKNMPFAEFVKIAVRNIRANIHFAPQLPEIIYGGQILPDTLGRFENLSYWWGYLRSICPLPLGKLPHYNKSRHGNYRGYFDDESRRLAEAVYADDLKYLGYEF